MSSVDVIDKSEIRDLYRDLILDHARSPRHFGKLPGATHYADGINPLCGDKLRLYLRLEDDIVKDAAFEGSGCAISMASASLLTDVIIGKPVDRAEDYFSAVTGRLTDVQPADFPDTELEKLRALDGVREFPSRVKCATLAWHALHSALNDEQEPATTE